MRFKGLTLKEVREKRKIFGLNKLPEAKSNSLLRLFLSQFDNLFVYLLIIAAIISFLIGELFEAFLILIVVIGNALFGFFQEVKADKSLEALQKMIVIRSKVIRDGILQEIDAQEIVPEDIILLEAGDIVPADGIVIEAKRLSVNEAVLTGESLPVDKLNKQKVYMGTQVLGGLGYVKVSAIGSDTKFGRIAKHLELIEKDAPLLKKKIKDLSFKIGILGAFISFFLVFYTLFIKGYSLLESFLFAASLAVAIVPEGLPLILTSVLAVGVKKMADKKSVVRRLSSIEGLGNINLILTDKTGTLTANNMRVKGLFDSEGQEIKEIYKKDFLSLNIALCSSARIYRKDKEYKETGDALEIALLKFLENKSISQSEILANWEYLDIRPFNSREKKMWVKVKNKVNGRIYEFTKGAVEVIINNCDKKISNQGRIVKFSNKKIVLRLVKEYMREGFKVLGFSFKNEREEVFIGFSLLYDPPRKEVSKAVSMARQFGVDTVMVTGDSREAGFYIAKETGIAKEGDLVIDGGELETLSDYELRQRLAKVKVFARVDPLQKQRIVKLYKTEGFKVAVTGDGVNDVAAIKQADVGVAMGSGTVVTKQAADLIILDDNYATLVKAISEGRKIIWDLRKGVKFLLSCNLLEVLIIIFSIIYFSIRVFSPSQILFINLITDTIPAFSFVFVRPALSVLKRKVSTNRILLSLDIFDIFSWTFAGSSIFAFYITRINFDILRSFAFVMIVYLQLAIFLFLILKAISLRSFFRNKWILLGFIFPLVIQIIIVNFIPQIFRLVSLPIRAWILLVGIIGLFVVILYFVNFLLRFFLRVVSGKSTEVFVK